MSSLACVHLGVHSQLSRLPSFDGLVNLKRMTIAYLFSITELPSFKPLRRLERLDLVFLPLLRSIPDLTPVVEHLRFVNVFRPNQVCCNGFIGTCDLSHPFCATISEVRTTQVTCIPETDTALRATPGTQQVFHKHANSICQLAFATYNEALTRETIDMCEGVPFRSCQLASTLANGTAVVESGICFNTRMQVLACSLDPLKIQLRRQQILLNIEPVCDPMEEEWLGCNLHPT